MKTETCDIFFSFFRNISKAQDIWDDIIVEYPTDIMALRFLTEYSIFFGPKARIRDSVARVLPRWKKEIPLYGYWEDGSKFCFYEFRSYF